METNQREPQPGLKEIYESIEPQVLKYTELLDGVFYKALQEAALATYNHEDAAAYFWECFLDGVFYVANHRKRPEKKVKKIKTEIQQESIPCIMERCNNEVTAKWRQHNICGKCAWKIEKEELQLQAKRISKDELIYHKRLSRALSALDFEFNMVSRRLKSKVDRLIGQVTKTRQNRK